MLEPNSPNLVARFQNESSLLSELGSHGPIAEPKSPFAVVAASSPVFLELLVSAQHQFERLRPLFATAFGRSDSADRPSLSLIAQFVKHVSLHLLHV